MQSAWSYRGRFNSSSSSSSSSSSTQNSLFSSSARSTPSSDIFKKDALELDEDDRNATSSEGSVSDEEDSSEDDDDEYNKRCVTPCWESHRRLLEKRGFRLDTFKDVKKFYERYWADTSVSEPCCSSGACAGGGCRDRWNDNAIQGVDPLPIPKPDVGTAAGYVRAVRGEREGFEGEDGLCRDAGLVSSHLHT